MKFTLPITFLASALLATNVSARWKPSPGLSWDYLLGAPDSVIKASDKQVVTIDIDEAPKYVNYFHNKGQRVICYFSGGTMQSRKWDYQEYKNAGVGIPGTESSWGNQIIDIRKKSKLQPLIRARMKKALDYGCDAVEVDSVDIYGEKVGITKDDCYVFAKWVGETAHDVGISVGLKNVPDIAPKLADLFDFAVVESCVEYNECGYFSAFTDRNKAVFIVHYENRGHNLSGSSLSKLIKGQKGHRFTCVLSKNRSLDHNCTNYDCDTGAVKGKGSSGDKPKITTSKKTTTAYTKKTTTTTIKRTTTTKKTTTTTTKKIPTQNPVYTKKTTTTTKKIPTQNPTTVKAKTISTKKMTTQSSVYVNTKTVPTKRVTTQIAVPSKAVPSQNAVNMNTKTIPSAPFGTPAPAPSGNQAPGAPQNSPLFGQGPVPQDSPYGNREAPSAPQNSPLFGQGPVPQDSPYGNQGPVPENSPYGNQGPVPENSPLFGNSLPAKSAKPFIASSTKTLPVADPTATPAVGDLSQIVPPPVKEPSPVLDDSKKEKDDKKEEKKPVSGGNAIGTTVAVVGGVATAAFAGFIFLKKNKKVDKESYSRIYRDTYRV